MFVSTMVSSPNAVRHHRTSRFPDEFEFVVAVVEPPGNEGAMHKLIEFNHWTGVVVVEPTRHRQGAAGFRTSTRYLFLFQK